VRRLTTTLLLLLVLFLIHRPILAQSNILINEFVINSSPQQVELLNITNQEVDISNWFIDDNGGKTYFTIPPETTIYPQSCLTFSANFYLNQQSADTIRLFDSTAPPTSSSANLIDSYHYSKSPGENVSFFRWPDSDENWATGESTIGLFNQSKINCIITPTLAPTPTPTASPIPPLISTIGQPTNSSSTDPIPTPTPQSYDHIYLSEAMVNPKTNENEWVELYNDNDYQVDLIGWYLDDQENGGSSPKKFNLSIPAKNYESTDLNSSMFNNDGDSVRLLNQNKIEIDSFSYENTVQGLSWGRKNFSAKDYCLQNSSKNQSNNSCYQQTATPTTILAFNQKKSTRVRKVDKKGKKSFITTNHHKRIVKLPKARKKGEVLAAKTIRSAPPFPSKNLSRLNLAHSFSFYALINSGMIILRFLAQK